MDDQELTDERHLRKLYSDWVGERQVGDRATCVAPEAILSVVLGETGESERLATLDHVMSCPACHREYEYLTAVEEAGAETERVAERRPATWRRVLPLALAASVVLAIGGVVLRDQVRSWSDGAERGTGQEITQYLPASGGVVSGPPSFAWKPVPGATRYVLEVLGPDGAIVFSDSTSDTSVTLPRADALTPGTTYRWWVRTLEEGAGEPAASPLARFRTAGP
jgi:hypothetical protein